MTKEDLQDVEEKRYLKEHGTYRKHVHNVFLHDLDDSVGSWLNEDKFKTNTTVTMNLSIP